MIDMKYRYVCRYIRIDMIDMEYKSSYINRQVERQEECAARAAFRGFDRLARGLLLTLQAAEPCFQPDVARRHGGPWGKQQK